MALTRFALAALRIPWRDLLKAAPAILTASGELVARQADRRRGSAEPAASPSDVAAMAQAETTRQMADQMTEATEALRVVALRVLFALGVSLVALALGVAALIRTFR
jgi:hypothetical protein